VTAVPVARSGPSGRPHDCLAEGSYHPAVVEPSFLLGAMGGTDCERIGAGWLAQPANAVSSLAYVAVAGWLLRDARRPENDRIVLVSSAAALAAVGAGSLAYHGPQPGWAPLVHDGSILGLGAVLFGVAVRGLVLRRPLGEPRRWRTAGVWAAAGLVAYAAGRTGSRLCRPESLLQLHGIWHGLSALALGAAVRIVSGQCGPALSRRPPWRGASLPGRPG
jgi:hypothetical protein